MYSRINRQGLIQRRSFTSYDVDWTVKVEAQGLKADTAYWYQFADCTDPLTVSEVGQTRTIASPNSKFLMALESLSLS